ncbi:proton myo-inositol cotransporter-like [Octopus vulgaris]|uniref:Proton myo-inositol cotransporter-like n=1 Tax=Octopus vulgaris TaxID=6645 RepID=A0AA36F8V2_OCTVU|nr:proton myo-inositol cotransporter-like [Octopus vulgaris]
MPTEIKGEYRQRSKRNAVRDQRGVPTDIKDKCRQRSKRNADRDQRGMPTEIKGEYRQISKRNADRDQRGVPTEIKEECRQRSKRSTDRDQSEMPTEINGEYRQRSKRNAFRDQRGTPIEIKGEYRQSSNRNADRVQRGVPSEIKEECRQRSKGSTDRDQRGMPSEIKEVYRERSKGSTDRDQIGVPTEIKEECKHRSKRSTDRFLRQMPSKIKEECRQRSKRNADRDQRGVPREIKGEYRQRSNRRLANGITLLMIGRAFLGFGIGLASTTVPIYIAECAPVSIRGQLVTLNNFFITGGQFVASVMDGLFSCVPEGWRYMLGLAGIPAVIQMIGFIFLPESPRWLISKGRHEEASKVLKNIRATDDIHEEFTNIKESVESNPVHGSLIYNLKRVFQSKTVRRALVVGCGLQLFQQLCGINTVMYYSASIIKMAGVREESKAIWYASLTAAVNFLAGFSGLWLIERFGRRKLAIGSLTGVFFSLTILAIGFQLSAINSPKNLNQTNLENDHCSYSTCDTCIVDDDCGFAYTDNGETVKFGYCLPKGNSSDDSDICSTETNSTANHEIFALDFCPSDYSWSAILGLVLYLMSFSPGMGPLPWTINSEIYPQWARGTCNSMATSVNWICNLLVSMTFLTLTDTITKYGTYWLFAFITGMGIIFVFTSLPETKGLPLEEVESLFNSPICSCGKKKNYKDIDNEK